MRPAKLFTYLLFLSASLNAAGNNIAFDSANAAYARMDYKKAIDGYEQILKEKKVSPELYYNLGNAYYKTGDLGHAILNYERAKKRSPDDEDIQVNLSFAMQKTEDKIEAAPALFLQEWKSMVVNAMTERAWSLLCISVLIVSLLLLGFYIVSTGRMLRQISFYSGMALFLVCILVFFLARHKYTLESTSDEAVVLSPSVTVNGSPSEKGTRLFLLHEGTKVTVLEVHDGWSEIRIANGNSGWLKNDQIERI
jgi:tetratricopeptide (TPR) repeat protein